MAARPAEETYESTLAALDRMAQLPAPAARVELPQGLDPGLARVLEGVFSERARLEDRMRDLAAAVVRYMQAVLPLVDTSDRVASAEVTLRSERALEVLDRRLEAKRAVNMKR